MGIYNYIYKINSKNKRKTAVAMMMDNGELIKYTYGRLFEEADVYAKRLSACGIKAGDRIMIAAENSPEWQMAFLAIMKIKATAVLLDASLGAEDLKQLIEKSDARCMYASHKVKEKLGDSRAYRIPILDIKAGGKAYKDSYKVLSPFIERTADPDLEVAVIIYSSGTTRSAAGIMHTHKAMIKTVQMTAEENEIEHYDRILSLLPNSHIYGVVTCLFGSMMLGASVCYVESINNETILNAFKTFKPTIFPCVPKVFELFERQIIRKIESKDSTKRLFDYFYPICLRLREETGIKLGKLIFRSVHKGFGGRVGLMTSAGAPLDEKVAAFYYAMGFDLLITYGLTETNIPIIGNRGDNITIDSCGTSYPGMDVQLVHLDETGEGEIYVRSPYMMKGYFRDPEATSEAFDEAGWFKTGDLARVDERGNVKITGRSKENIVLATGKKVTPSDIETHYTEIPGIDELVISGVPISGEHDEVHAFVVKKGLHLDESHIRQAIQERGAKLSQYMKIAKVHFLEEIPKTALQKPKRYLLKKHAMETGENQEEAVLEKQNEGLDKSKAAGEEFDTLKNLEQSLRQLAIEASGLDAQLITVDGKLLSKVGMDSLTAIEFAFRVEEQYKVNIEDMLKQDVCITDIAKHIETRKTQEENSVPCAEKNNEVVKVKEKTKLHYAIYKASVLLAHILYKVKVTYKKELPQDEGYIICANHVSNIDYLWVTQDFNEPRFNRFCCMAKKELFKDSWITNLLRDICGMIPVDRGGMNGDIMKLCKKQLEDKWGLLVHPEGTRSQNGELGTFKKGAATLAKDANVPIIPAYIKGGHDIFPRGRKLPKFFNFETKRRYEVEVIYGEPIYPGDCSADELILKVEKAIQGLSGIVQAEDVMDRPANVQQAEQIEEQAKEEINIVEDIQENKSTVLEETDKKDKKDSNNAEECEAEAEQKDIITHDEIGEEEVCDNILAQDETDKDQPVEEEKGNIQVSVSDNQDEEFTDAKSVKNHMSEPMNEESEESFQEEITLKELLRCDYEIDLAIDIEDK